MNNKQNISGSLQQLDDILHDGFLEGITTDGSHTLRLFLKTVPGEHYVLMLTGVVAARASDFFLGNIVSEVSVRAFGEYTPEDLTEFQEHGLASTTTKLFEKCASRRLNLIEISPSYGCSFICVAEKADFLPG